ncbi:hypothetical protein [Microtetraspora sp. NBRC 16547]|uniref:hypothetical protein n=1 Tax=Microtetraspora sp. NBRC 16547 TaxID=3030993 RepID=UPI0024A5AFB7|nr:hypothetical protein [Microtetraspora sp. NBRC 16547]GLW97722.1 hypothetical protein Misp02_18090 [Microtetraspora sp. NBRC 16547]
MTGHVSRTALAIVAIVVVLGAGIFFGAYYLLERAKPFALGEHCKMTTADGTLDLDIEQSEIAATIAAVAARRGLPERALQIAYVTAIQESKLTNLPYGDRDSVGVFQQRPSQGWGTSKQLQDPVYATRKFFVALEKVKGYHKMPLHEAAQAVQRSADGSAYAQHETQARILAGAFSGRVPKAVRCWYPPPDQPVDFRPEVARKQLLRELGDDSSAKQAWLVAGWYVTHAQRYGLREIRYDGVSWTASDGHDGWLASEAASGAKMVRVL